MDHRDPHDCPLCGSLMGAEAQPAAMRKQAEALDRLDRLEHGLRETERNTWHLTVQELVCGPCHERFVTAALERGDPELAALRARIVEVRSERAEAMRRSP